MVRVRLSPLRTFFPSFMEDQDWGIAGADCMHLCPLSDPSAYLKELIRSCRVQKVAGAVRGMSALDMATGRGLSVLAFLGCKMARGRYV